MNENLEKYLDEISHYLPGGRASKEILAEIESHILEKAQREHGSLTPESIEKTIDGYGPAQEVASKYVEGQEIISPKFKRYLFRYTALLFSLHLALTLVAAWFRTSIIALPFFFIPRMPLWALFIYLPMAFVYDFGVAALILYMVTQRGRVSRLPWFGVPAGRRGESGLAKPKPAVLAMLIVIFTFMLAVFLRYHTIFFYSINFSRMESLLDPASSIFFSILFLAAVACHVACYWIRFLINSAWVLLVEDGIVLLILWLAWNSPIKPQYKTAPGTDLATVGGIFLSILIVITFFSFIRNLVRLVWEMSLPRQARRA
ncbi:MAG: hypothetical protein MUF59_11020 [Candidatus Krumholzibacteria bacterium]|nr:hypothetical protein [Candidatus Krumholzibacteria bacterium]